MKNKNKIIILLGPPGVGKGTVSQYLKKNSNLFKHISLGSICREYAKEETELGRRIKSIIDEGNLIQIELVEIIISKILENFLIMNEKENNSQILILDGFPRTFEQVSLFLKLVNQYFHCLDSYIIFLYSDIEILQKRLLNRYICSNVQCDKIYAFHEINQNKNFICDQCENILYKRKDDDIKVIMNRLSFHAEEEIKIINYFNENNINFFKINGNNKIENIIDNFYELLDLKNNINIKCLKL